MFVVRRSFRNYNQMVTPGSIVEPGSIKRFKSRLRDKVIVEVTEQDFDKWNAYFIGKFGVSIGPIKDDVTGTPDGTPDGTPEGTPEGTQENTAPVVQATVVQATVVKPAE